MTRDDYFALLKRALASPHGIRLAYGDGQTAHRIRAKLYHIRDEIRAELRGKRQSDPALTYDLNGKPPKAPWGEGGPSRGYRGSFPSGTPYLGAPSVAGDAL